MRFVEAVARALAALAARPWAGLGGGGLPPPNSPSPSPWPRRPWSKWPWLALPLVAVLAFWVGTCLGGGDEEATAPGADVGEAADAGEAEDTIWTCSMHPQIRQHHPGKCPICGMDLIPATGAGEGPGRVSLSDSARALAQIRTEPVRRMDDARVERRLLGRIDHDETTMHNVTAWTGGRIDRLFVRVTGEKVRRGQVVASLYSPEVYAAEQDLIQAVRQQGRLQNSPTVAAEAARGAVEAARTRLRLLGVPEARVQEVEHADAPAQHIGIRTPFAGTIVERVATEGSYVQTGTVLYRIADLSHLWVQLDAYETDLGLLSVGQEVELDIDAFPGEPFTGHVAFIDPVLDPRRRTARVRVELPNPDGRLRPGMFAEAVVRTDTPGGEEQPLVIPDTAPLFTGRRSVVYVEVPGADRPTYDVRVVRLGLRVGHYYPVVEGLSEGEHVVVNGAFALDADLQIRGGASMMTRPDDLQRAPAAQPVEAPGVFRRSLAPIVQAYLHMQEALAQDDLAAAKRAGTAIETAVDAAGTGGTGAVHDAWQPLAQQLTGHGQHVAGADSLDSAREGFVALSEQVVLLLRVFGNPLEEEVHVAFCPMANNGQGAEWVQQPAQVANPFYGQDMPTCGEIRAAVEGGSHLEGTSGAAAAPSGSGEHTTHQHPAGAAGEHAAHAQGTAARPSRGGGSGAQPGGAGREHASKSSGTVRQVRQAAAGSSPEPQAQAAQPAAAEVWTCRMHPQIRESGPGQCPICGMNLVRVSGGSSP